jgi:hypothetical protein
MEEKFVEKSPRPQNRHLTPGGPGRPKGQRNFATLYREAIIKIAQSANKEPDDLELEIIEQGVRKARNGDIRFYQDLLDRVHGKAVHNTITDITSKGEKIVFMPAEVINRLDDATRKTE